MDISNGISDVYHANNLTFLVFFFQSSFKVDLGGIHKDWGEPKVKAGAVTTKVEGKVLNALFKRDLTSVCHYKCDLILPFLVT